MKFQKRNFWDYEKAREFVRALGLKSSYDYKKYVDGLYPDLPEVPERLPKSPYYYYRSTGDWNNWHDFLGDANTVNSGIGVMSYEEAREFASQLNLQSNKEWASYVQGEFPDLPPLPNNLPMSAGTYYAARGTWEGWGDFLGTGNKGYRSIEYMPYEEARVFARTLGLRSRKEWEEYANGEIEGLPPKPENIPLFASRRYRKTNSWVSWEDFLGYDWLNYKQAKAFVHQLRLKSLRQWKDYTQGKFPQLPPIPAAIPVSPQLQYPEWENWGEWLGTGRIQYKKQKKWDFEHARRYVHTLGIESVEEWHLYCKGKLLGRDLKPHEIPHSPSTYYEEWQGYADWLGNGKGKGRRKPILPYEEAHQLVVPLGLKTKQEWGRYLKGEFPKLPKLKKGIPRDPYSSYRDEGWVNWKTWLQGSNSN